MGNTVTKFQEPELLLKTETVVKPFVGTIFIKCESVSDAKCIVYCQEREIYSKF